jgi:Ca-activated chloride channel homolog
MPRKPILLAIAIIALFASLLRADGLIVIHDPPRPIPGHFTFAPLEVTYHHVTVKIDDLVAVTSVDQEFYNPNAQQLEGTYLFPLPIGSHIDKFEMDVNGRMQEAELLDADKARSYYEEIVRKAKDPALLEYTGQGAFRARIFPIEPHGRKRVKISYTQLLKSDTGLVDYLYPLNTEKFSSKPLREVSVKVELACKEPLKSVYSPSHSVEIKRDGDRRAVIGYEAHNIRPDTDFKLIYQRTSNPIGVDLMTWRSGADGYFLLLASPGMDVPATEVQKKDICFVVDTSGSMAEQRKLEQAKRALQFCLANLNEGDRFEIIRFSTEAEALFGGLTESSRENVEKARGFVDGLKPIGGTAIHEALTRSLDLGRSRSERERRPYVVIFLTDGLPTVGTTDPQKIADGVTRSGDDATRIFSFGIGTDVNTHLLDKIATATNAFSQYVLANEDLEVKLSSFYSKIREPVLSNLEVAFVGDGVRTSQLYPGKLPDLFKGEQVVLYGRYEFTGSRAGGDVPAAVKISGMLNGEKREFTTDVKFTDRAEPAMAFIPRLWATRRVGWLLDEIRLHGESKELKDEVVKLAREHGIVTPYTSYLIIEDEARRNVPIAMQTQREMKADEVVADRSREVYEKSAREARDQGAQSGADAVANARNVGGMKGSSSLDDLDPRAEAQAALAKPSAPVTTPGEAAGGGGEGYRHASNYAQQARVVNGRAFYQNGKTWTDAQAQNLISQNAAAARTQQIKFNSDDYFALLKRYPDAAAWLSLGEEVDIVLDDVLYQIRG